MSETSSQSYRWPTWDKSAVYRERIFGALFSATSFATLAVAAATVLNLLLRLVIGRVIARPIGPEVFGQLVTLEGVLVLPALLTRFGFLVASRLYVVRTETELQRQEATGAIFLVAILRGAVLAVALIPGTLFIRYFYGAEIAAAAMWIVPLVVFLPLAQMIPLLVPAYGRTSLLVQCQLVGTIGWLVLGGTVVHLTSPKLPLLGLCRYLAMLTVVPVALVVLRPVFGHLRGHLMGLLGLWKSYGIHQYFAQLCDQGTTQIMILLLPAMAGPSEYGYYVLAQTIAVQTGLLSTALFQARFRRIAGIGWVPRKFVFANLLCIGVFAVGILAIQKLVIVVVYGSAFSPVSRLIPGLVLAEVIRSGYRPYLTAVGGWGDARFKYTSFIAGPVAVVLYPVLISYYGVNGAVAATVLLAMVWLVLVVGFYWMFRATALTND